MAYLGKEFKFEKQENFDGFVNALGLSDGQGYFNYKPNIKLTKSGDSYTLSLITPDKTKDITFTPGVKFHETVRDAYEAETVFTVNGDTFTQVQDFGPKGTVTFKRAFSDNELVIVKSTYTVDGNTVTQVIKHESREVTFKREYSGDKLKVTITSSFWDCVATRYYNA